MDFAVSKSYLPLIREGVMKMNLSFLFLGLLLATTVYGDIPGKAAGYGLVLPAASFSKVSPGQHIDVVLSLTDNQGGMTKMIFENVLLKDKQAALSGAGQPDPNKATAILTMTKPQADKLASWSGQSTSILLVRHGKK
jgi:hypothetical protein